MKLAQIEFADALMWGVRDGEGLVSAGLEKAIGSTKLLFIANGKIRIQGLYKHGLRGLFDTQMEILDI